MSLCRQSLLVAATLAAVLVAVPSMGSAPPRIASTLSGQAVIFVDDDAPLGGDGLTWNTAYRFLQDALASASDGTEIHVAQGIYQPDLDESGSVIPGDRAASFTISFGTTVSGGFAGIGAPDPDARDPNSYETVLSADLLGDDGPDFTHSGENAYHVLSVQSQTPVTLQGLTIRGGFANGPDLASRRGGALRAVVTDLTIDRCKVEQNFADLQGGGIYLLACRAVIENSAFTGNTSDNSDGGAICFNGTSSEISQWLRLRSCEFLENECGIGFGGGAVCAKGPHSQPGPDNFEITNCRFTNNFGSKGGALFLDSIGDHGHSDLGAFPVTGCTFEGNVGGFGGALWIGQARADLFECVFVGNTGSLGGGAYVFADDQVPVTIRRCMFLGNVATNTSGGGLHLNRPGNSLAGCIFIGNVAAANGGGALFANTQGNGELTLSNCTFFGNEAGELGGGSYVLSNGAVFSSSVFWQNTDSGGGGESAQIDMPPLRTVTVNYSCIDEWTGASMELLGTGNHGEDPLLVDPDGIDGVLGTSDDDVRLQPGSPCIDAGDNEAVASDKADLDGDGDTSESVPFDLDDNPRFVDDAETPDTGNGTPPIVDMGAYEFQLQEDSDNDGIPDDEDACPNSDLSETVVIDSCDSGVANLLFEDGCTMADLTAECADGAANHGQFVSCVAHLTNEWKNAGLINGQEKGRIQSCAARSNIPGDLDGDGAVGVADLVMLLGGWGPCPAQPDACPADVDLDDIVGITDLLILLGNWG